MLILIKIKIIFYTKLSYVILNLNPLFKNNIYNLYLKKMDDP
jgi:hypothetical protein